jgi:predicted dehydrogenase
MPDGKKYRVAVIGRTGKGDYGHGLDVVWVQHPRAELVAVADENEAGRAAAAKRLGVKATYADYPKMLAAEKPQIVSVAPRWLDAHRDMVVACAEHGASIFLEKPIARTLQEADEMVAACDRHHVKCAIAHQTRYSLRVKAVMELIASGRIGDVVELHGHGKCDRRGGGEDLMVLGTHAFDLMRFLVGDPRWCFARVTVDGRKATPGDVRQFPEGIGPGVGDHIAATYGFGKPIVGHFTTFKTKAGASARYWLEVRGTKGIIHLGYGALPPAYLCEDPSWMPGKSKAPWQEITSAGVGKPEPLKAADVGNGNRWIADDLIAAIEEDRPPLGSIADGRAALEMILAVYESHRLGRPVDLPLKNRRHPLASS